MMKHRRFVILVKVLKASIPYVLMSLSNLCLAIFMILLESVVSKGVSAFVIVVYEHLISTFILAFLAFFLEKNTRPPLSFKILSYAFLLGLLQITLCQLLLTMSLKYIDSNYQSVALNLVPAVVFVLALIFQQEKLMLFSMNGQIKILGLLISIGGALLLILWKGPVLLGSHFIATQDTIFGILLIIVAVLASGFWNVVVGHVTKFYPADISLTAMMSLFGTIQSGIVAAFTLSTSSWEPNWEGGLTLLTILVGGVLVTGLFYYASTWTIKKRGAVFGTAFNPLLVVFSFLLDTFVMGSPAHVGSIVGAIMVILGLYLLLWAKSNETKKKELVIDGLVYPPLIQHETEVHEIMV